MSRELPPLAPWIAGLPRDSRGFPVPTEAGWEGGRPVFSKVGTERKIALGMRRACAICGYEMPRGATVYRAFAQSDAAHMRQYERERSHDLGGPLHLSCILFSAMACPYLREKTSRLGKDSSINPGGRRGTRAAVMGFEDFGLLLYSQPHTFLDPTMPPPHFAYLNLSVDIGYRDGGELAERYEAAVESDAKLIDTSTPRLFWKDSDDEMKQLGALLRADFDRLNSSTPEYELFMAGWGPYAAFLI